jgi:hypothetical protein
MRFGHELIINLLASRIFWRPIAVRFFRRIFDGAAQVTTPLRVMILALCAPVGSDFRYQTPNYRNAVSNRMFFHDNSPT